MKGDAVQQIKERLAIVDVVASYVELFPAGKHMKALCPFHNEKTPSFTISPDRGMYYCYGCSKGGDIFTFMEEIEGVEFKEALKMLAEKAGVELVAEDPKKRTERETGYAILENATKFFTEKLNSKSDALKYLENRSVTIETIKKWQIGYAPGPPQGGWRELRNYLNDKEITDTQMEQTGLIKGSEGGKEPYDVFRDRVMFPLFNSNGKVIAFSGRILTKDSEAPKYVNSPETDFFNKSEVLYGYDKAKQGIRHYDFSLIVEGQFDVVLCHQAGYTNTVAVSGTALTAHHVSLLQRLSSRVVLALDADNAGIAAVKRGADIMLSRGIDVKVARIPEGNDPADIIKENPVQFKEIISKATHVIEFLLLILKEQAKDDRSFKLSARDEILPYLLKMQNKIDAEHFVGVIAETLDTTKVAIRLEVARLEEDRKNKSNIIKKNTSTVRNTVNYISNTKSRKDDLIDYLAIASEVLEKPEALILKNAITLITHKDVDDIINSMDSNQKSKLLFTIESTYSDIKKHLIFEDINDKLYELQLSLLRMSLNIKKKLLYTAEREGDTEKIVELMKKTTILQKELTEASVLHNIFEFKDEKQLN